MKPLIVAAWVWGMAMGMTGVAQEMAIPFDVGDLGPNQQNQLTQVDVRGGLALIGRRQMDGVSVAAYRRNGAGVWQFEDTVDTGDVADLTLNPAFAEAAVLIGGAVRFHRPFFPPDWNFTGAAGGITLPAGEEGLRVVLEGDRLAVLARGTGEGFGSRVRVYERTGSSWSQVAVKEFPGGGPFVGLAAISALALEGTRVALGIGAEEIRIFERDQGGAGNWGEVVRIDGAARGFVELGDSLALDGNRLAAAARGPDGQLRAEVFSRNEGGANAWGWAGTVFTAPSRIGGLLLDADAGRLLVFGVPGIADSLLAAGGPAEAWWFGPGAGPTGWVLERRRDLGALRGGFPIFAASVAPRWAAISGDETFFGVADEEYYDGASRWAAVAHRRNAGGTAAWNQVQLFDSGVVADGFGKAIGFHGGILAVGMPDDAWMGAGTGSVMLWWMPVTGVGDGQILIPLGRVESPNPQAGELFGSAVAVSTAGAETGADFPPSVLLAVGAPGRNGGRGAAYAYEVRGTVLTGVTLIPAGTLDPGDLFGASVAVMDERVLGPGGEGLPSRSVVAVGAAGDDDGGTNFGAVYLFEADLGGTNAWGQRAKRGRPAGVSGTGFGRKVAVAEAVGARFLLASRPPIAGSPGQIAVFGRNQGGTDAWGLDSVINPPAGSPPGFAAGLHASDSVVGVGATGNAGGTGKAYLYGRLEGMWAPVLDATGTAADGPDFGREVAVSPFQLVVGAAGAGAGNGRISVYGLSSQSMAGWGLLFTRSGSGGERLGEAVGSWRIFSAAGAPDSAAWGSDAGRVLVDRAGSYEVWAKARGPAFLPRWRPGQDSDGDDQENVIEFALGSEATNVASRGRFEMVRGIYSPTTPDAPAMIWDEPVLPYFHALLDWRVDGSATLETWNLEEFRSSSDGGVTRRHYRVPVTGGDRRFYRLSPRYPWIGPVQGATGGGIIIVE